MKRKNTSDLIYEQIKQDFVNDKIKFGEKLVETELAKKLDVSRTPLREALKMLEYEGIIVRLANGRLKVIELDTSKIDEIFNIRIALENMLYEQLIFNQDFLKNIDDNIKRSENFIKNEQIDLARKEISQFTNILYNHFTHDFTIKILSTYNVYIAKIKNQSLSKDERTHTALAEHKGIYQALKLKNLETVCNLNKKHLIGARNSIKL